MIKRGPRSVVIPDSRQSWIGLVGLALSGATVYGAGLYAFTLLSAPLAAEYGWTHAATGAAIAIFWLSAPASFLMPFLSKRFSLSTLFLTGVVLAGTCICATAFVTNFTELLAIRFFVGIGKVMVMSMTNLIIVVLFRRNFALALGLASAGWHLGGIAFPPIAQTIIENYGWRASAGALGLLVLTVTLPLIYLTLGKISNYADVADIEKVNEQAVERGHSMPLWGVLILTLCFYATYSYVFVNIPAILREAGFSSSLSVDMLSLVALSAFAGVIVTGQVLNHLSKSRLSLGVFAFFVLQLLSILGMILTIRTSTAAAMMFLVMFGVMVGGADVGWVNMLRESAGARRFPKIFSAWYFTQLAGLFVGPVLGGWVNDHVGSYRATLHFVLDAALVNAVLMGIFVIGINRIKSRNQSKLLS